MNTLFFPAGNPGPGGLPAGGPELQRILNSSQPVAACISAVAAGQFPLEIEGAEGSFNSLLLASLYQAAPGRCFAVVPQENDAADLALDLAAVGIPALHFPWWGAAPYNKLPPLSAVFGERAKVLGELVAGTAGIVIIPERALLTPLPPPGYVKSLLVSLKPGGAIDTAALAKTLVSYGYTRVPQVQVHGEFALRGEVLDIFMGGDDEARRVLFDFDRVETIRRFDPVNQGSVGERGRDTLSELLIRPLREVVWTDDRIGALADNLSRYREFGSGGTAIIDALVSRRRVDGEELLYPLAFDAAGSLLDYMGEKGTLVLFDRERLENAQENLSKEYHGLYVKAVRSEQTETVARGNVPRTRKEYPLPERLLLDFKTLIKGRDRIVSFKTITGEPRPGFCHIDIPCDPARSFFGNINYLKEEIASLLAHEWRIVVAAETEVQAERIRTLLVPHESLHVTTLPISAGFSLPDIRVMVIQENEIFGRRKRPPRSLKTVRSSPIDTFLELSPGDHVVHINHGIGLFKGIERIKALGHERDYIQLEYADAETIYVPVEQVNLVQRYIGNDGHAPRLDLLGSKGWEARKNRVRKSVADIAEKLISLYSRRKNTSGFAFPKDNEWQTMFEAAFPFEETEDQVRCVEEIKEDMENPFPMDRLVCGDVGYGKTEVAVRACFKAIMGGRQAAFLAPTTILVEQHYHNFLERFSQFPVRLAMLSRFVPRRRIQIILQQLQDGEIDLIVGTHRLVQRDVRFKNLGLIVIDEEQRFGVTAKEKLKELKTNVDCLAISATPIPRTLHMSFLKIRDMSLLATPPRNRHPIETFIEEYNDERLAQAIRNEVSRGGQIFFLHNNIESLKETRLAIEHLVPEMSVEIAHGKMDIRELEDVMRRFVHGGFHVLVSTTIIENGIDIPNVNTIIIDRADIYGVSQLYQLRGRVGRSDRVAYAYLFYPGDRALSELAMKRLQVISDFTELGSGFKIAIKDMEIRGVGNLLGSEQSGEIYSVGFDLYLRLLDEAAKRLEDSGYEAETETLLELEYSGFIPDSYIDSPQEKMEVYKMIAAIRDKEELDRVYAALLDRFGPLPDEAASLLALAEIRIICREIAVSSLRERGGVVRVEFARVSRIKVERLVRLMQESSGKVRLDPKQPNVLTLTTGMIGLKEKSEFIREKLASLA